MGQVGRGTPSGALDRLRAAQPVDLPVSESFNRP